MCFNDALSLPHLVVAIVVSILPCLSCLWCDYRVLEPSSTSITPELCRVPSAASSKLMRRDPSCPGCLREASASASSCQLSLAFELKIQDSLSRVLANAFMVAVAATRLKAFSLSSVVESGEGRCLHTLRAFHAFGNTCMYHHRELMFLPCGHNMPYARRICRCTEAESMWTEYAYTPAIAIHGLFNRRLANVPRCIGSC